MYTPGIKVLRHNLSLSFNYYRGDKEIKEDLVSMATMDTQVSVVKKVKRDPTARRELEERREISVTPDRGDQRDSGGPWDLTEKLDLMEKR